MGVSRQEFGVGCHPFSRGASQPRDQTQVSCTADSSPPEPPGKPCSQPRSGTNLVWSPSQQKEAGGGRRKGPLQKQKRVRASESTWLGQPDRRWGEFREEIHSPEDLPCVRLHAQGLNQSEALQEGSLSTASSCGPVSGENSDWGSQNRKVIESQSSSG